MNGNLAPCKSHSLLSVRQQGQIKEGIEQRNRISESYFDVVFYSFIPKKQFRKPILDVYDENCC